MGRSGFFRLTFCFAFLSLDPALVLPTFYSCRGFAPTAEFIQCRGALSFVGGEKRGQAPAVQVTRPSHPWRLVRMGVEIGAELRERFGHILAAVAEANVSRLVVDSSRQE